MAIASFGDGLVNAVIRDEVIDQVEVIAFLSIQLDHDAVLDFDAGLGVIGTVLGNQSHVDPFLNEAVLVDRSVGKH